MSYYKFFTPNRSVNKKNVRYKCRILSSEFSPFMLDRTSNCDGFIYRQCDCFKMFKSSEYIFFVIFRRSPKFLRNFFLSQNFEGET